MKVFLDFDDVIFNTKDFVIELRNLFASHGVTEDIFKKYYYDEKNPEVKIFNPWATLKRIEENEKRDVSALRKKFEDLLLNLSWCMFPDVEKFLKFVGKDNVFLISFGLPDFQNKKIIGCGLDKMIGGCIVTNGSKAEAIGKVLRELEINENEKMFFVDDRCQHIEEIKTAFPNIKTFLLCRKEGRYCDPKTQYCDYEVHGLREVEKIIDKFKSNEKN